MNRHTTTYWLFQVTGWSLYGLTYSFFYLTIRKQPQPYFFEQLITHVIIGVTATHIMRSVIRKTGILSLSLKKQIITLTILSLCFATLIGVSIVAIEAAFRIQSERLRSYSFLNIAIRFAFSYFHFVLLWNLLYFTYHYIQKTKQQKIDQARLESILKELEIATLKAHINPHFIFNSLNSIRALVVEDPVRARSAITQLSNILRSSMQVDKAEKTLFEKELDVIKDYLSLEQVRFEDRLQVSYDIEEDTLDHPVPAMILQALVENALKFGLNNEPHVSSIFIFSRFNHSMHHFGVRSSGSITDYTQTESAGIAELQKRLQLLYGSRAHLAVNPTKDGLIDAVVSIPL